ncbi:hypothetical protein [Micromonospora deserti]|uniref:Uncharacterized protein n=1 Tax=Micromonospora deserti TaxID=2070366 RepID=A0A2W2CTC4_9ACTN|nr:hypothetical protein [Micromonospora deserti]PZG02756.1 hypothetical protein C1I99_00935 [Micromonospora deserti]
MAAAAAHGVRTQVVGVREDRKIEREPRDWEDTDKMRVSIRHELVVRVGDRDVGFEPTRHGTHPVMVAEDMRGKPAWLCWAPRAATAQSAWVPVVLVTDDGQVQWGDMRSDALAEQLERHQATVRGVPSSPGRRVHTAGRYARFRPMPHFLIAGVLTVGGAALTWNLTSYPGGGAKIALMWFLVLIIVATMVLLPRPSAGSDSVSHSVVTEGGRCC